MKILRIVLPAVLLSFSSLAFGQAAQTSFDQIKSLAGTWEGTLTTVPAAVAGANQGKQLQVSLHVVRGKGNEVNNRVKAKAPNGLPNGGGVSHVPPQLFHPVRHAPRG